MNLCENYQRSFNRYPIQRPGFVLRPEKYLGLDVITSNCIVRGLGGSYGDAALNNKGHIILTERLDRFFEFDEQQGIISVEAGISLAKVLDVIVSRGWFLPVTPGTRNVTLGGCVAADVHGKNHLQNASIGNHVLALELIVANGERVWCSPDSLPELFWATIGGMGLTGIIGTITLKLKRVESAYVVVQYQTANDLAETFDLFSQENPQEYAVAWLDGLNLPLGRSVIMRARHADLEALSLDQKRQPFVSHSHKTYQLPFCLPSGLLHQKFIKAFNNHYYQRLAKKEAPSKLCYGDFFYPLDRLTHWPRLYGKQGFLQYQCAVPFESAFVVTKQILEILNRRKFPVYLAVLKRFGQGSLAPLSFPLSGFTLAVDLPIVNQELFNCLDDLDAMVITAGGRVYLAKDARLKPQAFRAMYPRYEEWLAVKKQWDSENKFSSSLAKRLEISPLRF
ncbi:MAG: FAD-binding oxidoreductase [Rickettsiella sp.]|nr:FAD-binding oxidoreductase [Rickettsiella sp.]